MTQISHSKHLDGCLCCPCRSRKWEEDGKRYKKIQEDEMKEWNL